jgi:hypothetical protein
LNGTHHCIVAQLAFDGAPIFIGASPESSDKLAQRNLQVTRSDNPGPATTHRTPQTFDIRPSASAGQGVGLSDYPDELMIDWGLIPPGSVASIYWPQVQASDVLALASSLYGSHTLSIADANTIQCPVTGGVTYIPIPAGAGENFAGLFTVDLPPSVTAGQEFNIVIRRIATRQIPKIELHSLPPTIGPGARARRSRAAAQPEPAPREPEGWRYVVGTFQVKIPVTTGDSLLLPEENTLAIMKWRLQQMAPSNRWYPVLQRYVDYVAARVDGLGGNSQDIVPSPEGVPAKDLTRAGERVYSGKVCEVSFDCFGDFEGFVLSDCAGAHNFRTRQRGIGELVLRACKEELPLSVYVENAKEHRILKLIVRC